VTSRGGWEVTSFIAEDLVHCQSAFAEAVDSSVPTDGSAKSARHVSAMTDDILPGGTYPGVKEFMHIGGTDRLQVRMLKIDSGVQNRNFHARVDIEAGVDGLLPADLLQVPHGAEGWRGGCRSRWRGGIHRLPGHQEA